jgi:hypothetical protein
MINARLREIASSPALREWAVACPETTFVGVCRVETKHATYLFRNGSCFAATGKGERAGGTSTELVGMKIVGWLLPEDEAPPQSGQRPISKANGNVQVTRTWRPGARAVLTSKGRLFTGPRTAVTSQVTSFAHFAEGGASRPRPPMSELTRTSLTRVHVAAPV